MKKLCCTIICLKLFGNIQAQGIGIGTQTPDAAAKLEIFDSNRGVLLPRVQLSAGNSFAPLNGIPSPANHSLLVYNTATGIDVTPGFYYWNNPIARWVRIQDAAGYTNGWSTTGNAAIDTAVHFLGTTDLSDIRIKVNNIYTGAFKTDGQLFLGTFAGQVNRGSNNLAYGAYALMANTTGSGLTALGWRALCLNKTGANNTATGMHAMYSNQIGSENVATGNNVLYSNQTGNNNCAFGFEVMYDNISGSFNTAVGTSSLNHNVDGTANTALGNLTLFNNVNGISNTALGQKALYVNVNGYYNTAVGNNALFFNKGTGNTGVGHETLFKNNAGEANTALGYKADVLSDGLKNATAIGAYAVVNSSNKLRLGGAGVVAVEASAPLSVISDGRFKTDIADSVAGLEFIKALRPVTYHFDAALFSKYLLKDMPAKPVSAGEPAPDYGEASSILWSGFIAQEVEAAAKKCGYDFSGLHVPRHKNDYYSLAYSQFVVPLVKAVQQQQQIIDMMRLQINALQTIYEKK